MYKVSIVVPTYNCGEYISECLDSILKQLYEDWECIIVDDGSHDETQAIVENYLYLDRRFKYIRRQRNKGLSAALNVGYANSVGQYLCQVDADDILLPLALEHTVKYLNTHKNVGLVYTNKLVINQEGNRFEPHWGNKEFYSPMKLFYSNTLVTHFRLMRREVFFRVGGYDEHIYFAEDDDFSIRVAWGIHRKGHLVKPTVIQKLESACYLYRMRYGSLTHEVHNRDEMYNNRERLKRKVMWSPCKFWRLNTLKKQILWDIYLRETGQKWQ